MSRVTLWLVGFAQLGRQTGKGQPRTAPRSLATVDVSQRRRVLAQLSRGTYWISESMILMSEASYIPRQAPRRDRSRASTTGSTARASPDGRRIVIGLQRPVLRGWVMIVERNFADGPVIEPQPNGPGIRRYRQHFLDLRGA